MKYLITIFTVLLLTVNIYAQDNTEKKVNFIIGAGIMYTGFGYGYPETIIPTIELGISFYKNAIYVKLGCLHNSDGNYDQGYHDKSFHTRTTQQITMNYSREIYKKVSFGVGIGYWYEDYSFGSLDYSDNYSGFPLGNSKFKSENHLLVPFSISYNIKRVIIKPSFELILGKEHRPGHGYSISILYSF